jgi:hypothetical protein
MSHPVRSLDDVSRGWNPWRALRERRHLRLVFAELPKSCGRGALLEEADGTRTVLLDYRLERRDRNAVLAHELVHDERDVLYFDDAPIALVAKEESYVNREVSRRLVPPPDLTDLVEQLERLGEPVHAVVVAEEFDVPLDVAQRALWLLEQRRSA